MYIYIVNIIVKSERGIARENVNGRYMKKTHHVIMIKQNHRILIIYAMPVRMTTYD